MNAKSKPLNQTANLDARHAHRSRNPATQRRPSRWPAPAPPGNRHATRPPGAAHAP